MFCSKRPWAPRAEPPRVASAFTVSINIVCEVAGPLEVGGYMFETGVGDVVSPEPDEIPHGNIRPCLIFRTLLVVIT